MADVVDAATRSRMMAGIRGKNTQPELNLRRGLFARGFRYRIHVRDLPGRPDMYFPKYRAVIHIHGCFWHRHRGCQYAYRPKTRQEFWSQKFRENVSRDRRQQNELVRLGLRVMVVWECTLRSPEDIHRAVDAAAAWLVKGSECAEYPVVIR